MFDLSRFKKAQEEVLATVLEELRNAKKVSHWMWFIFPQVKGLGKSETSQFYALDGLEEAKAYLEDKTLRDTLYACTRALTNNEETNIVKILGELDAVKFHSSMTIFYLVDHDQVFKDALDKFFNGSLDMRTIDIVNG